LPAKEAPAPPVETDSEGRPVAQIPTVRLQSVRKSLRSIQATIRIPQRNEDPLPCEIPGLPPPLALAEIPHDKKNSLAMDEDYAYVAIAPRGVILRIDLTSGAHHLIVRDQSLPSRLQVHAGKVFWLVHEVKTPASDDEHETAEAFRLLRHDVHHGIRRLYEGEIASDVLTYHAGRLYWLNNRSRTLSSISDEGRDSRTIARWDRIVDAGGETRKTTKGVALGVHQGRAYWAVEDMDPPGRASRGSREAMMSVGLDGSNPRVDNAFPHFVGPVHFENGVMLAFLDTREFVGVAAVVVAGATPIAVAWGPMGGFGLDVDGMWLYGVVSDGGRFPGHLLTRVPLLGGDPCLVHMSSASIEDLHIENGRVLWIETDHRPEPPISDVKMLMLPQWQ
jgi:hypothetical protein